MTGPYTFTRLAADELPLVNEWLRRPHVAAWWDDQGPDGESEIAQVVAERDGDTVPYLVRLAGKPFGYLQCSALEPGIRGIDQFIGEPELLGRGHGSVFIRLFCDRLFDAHSADAVTTDPDPGNARAVRAYAKAGFRPVGPRSEPPKVRSTGDVLLMRRDRAAPRERATP
jgi:aminoglycoside 6'-N-acetyltransferase